jgi:hypothetical protein
MRHGIAVLASVFLSGGVLPAQIPPADNIPNWSVPATWSLSGAAGGYQTMTDISSGIAFVAIEPCRIADTRGISGFGGQAGGPALAANVTRVFQIGGSPSAVPAPPNGCAAGAIPMDASAVSFQFTVVSPSADGNLIAWNGGAVPQVSVINWPAGTVALGNGTIVPLSAGTLSARLNMAAGQTAHLVIDVNGYFSVVPADFQNTFRWTSGNSNSLGVAFFENNNFATSPTIGVRSQVHSTGNGTAAFTGLALGATGNTFGAKFLTSSNQFNSAGVKGISGYGDPLGDDKDCESCDTAGVRGVDNGAGTSFGVLGLSRASAVGGILLDPADTTSPIDSDAEGYLGFRASPTVFYGVVSFAGTGATGVKSFIEPHKSDPTKVIRYVSLEGNEAGTYFRGKGRFQRGIAVIAVPEDFRLVTDEEGLSIQVTPIGNMATVAVQSIGLDRIVVRGSRNVEFFYTVNGVRSAFRGHQPIGEGREFVPRSPEAKIPKWLSEGQKQFLIQNGTYKADGTVNMETARRLGWDRVWEEARRPAPQPENTPEPRNP